MQDFPQAHSNIKHVLMAIVDMVHMMIVVITLNFSSHVKEIVMEIHSVILEFVDVILDTIHIMAHV